jgi:hypothetical protein
MPGARPALTETIMSDNVTTIGKIYEAFGRGDVPFILSCLVDDVE